MDGTSLGNFCVPDGGLFRVNRFSSSVLLDFMWIVPVWDYSGSWDRYWDMAMEHPAFLEFWRIFRRFLGHISHCLPMFFPKMGSGGGPKTLPIKLGSNPWFRSHMTPWKYGSQPHLRGGERWIKATAGMGQIGGCLGIHFGVLIRLTQTCVTVGLPGASISIPCPFFLVKPPLCCW